MPGDMEVFAEQVLKTRVADPAVVGQFLASRSAQRAESSIELAKLLVRNGLLTRFQAEEILNGRARSLQVGNYVLLEVLGYGGMGLVYMARPIDDDLQVAVKLLGEKHKHDQGLRARFQLEARAGMLLDHPRLVKTFDVGEREDLFGKSDYMVMELFHGVTLLEGISFSNGPMKWDAACDVISQAAEGLGYVHERGMVHRDVKPDNILVDVNGEVKMLDFGLTLAGRKENEAEFSLAMIFGHDCLGTADFIPPEQSLDSFSVDGRADVYGLGCALYVALTAQRPFPRERTSQTVKAHRSAPRPRVDAVNAAVPRRLADLVQRMMAIAPEERPESMQQVRELLAPYARRRRWAFNFDDVLARRRELKRALLTRSRLESLQTGRATGLNVRSETDAPGRSAAEE